MARFLLASLILTVFLFPTIYAYIINCHIGSYYIPLKDGNHACDLCPSGTFMPYVDHKETKCFDCMKIEDDRLEILVEECDRKHDSLIHCIPGYYRRRGRNPDDKERCVKCTRCNEHLMYEILPCNTYNDTHCCSGENYDVVPNHDGVLVCEERPWLCRQGEYFDLNCLPCPDNTFMHVDYHSMTECFKCQSSSKENLPKHAIIIEPCNSTHQAVLGCKDGFYINQAMGYGERYRGCLPCKTCNSDKGMYEGRKCGRDHDTVCCQSLNMTVIDTKGGLVCIPLPTTSASTPLVSTTLPGTVEIIYCGVGQYLFVDINNSSSSKSSTCQSCPYDTYMDEPSHTKTECKNCTEFKGQHLPGSCPRTVRMMETEEKDMAGIIAGTFMGGLVLGVLITISCYVCCQRQFG